MTNISEDIRSIYTMVPIWRPDLWKAIQSRDYQQAEVLLGEFLKNEFSAEQWKEIYWGGILNGIPSFRGALGKDEWEQNALPAITRAVRDATSDETLHTIYSSLQEKDLKKLRELMLRATSEADAEKHTPFDAPQTEQQVVFSQPPSQDAPQGVPLQQEPTPPQQPVQKEERTDLLSPGFKAQPAVPQDTRQADQAATPAQPAPFVLHKETEIQPLASGETVPLSRPQFFKSTAKEKPREAPSTARLEIGADAAPEAQQAGQTKKETPKVVNYTGPVTQVDPFERPKAKKGKAPQPQEETPPKEVSPENIVNLKDLPK